MKRKKSGNKSDNKLLSARLSLPKEVVKALSKLAKAANLDGSYGEFDILIGVILADQLEISYLDFRDEYEWEFVEGFNTLINVRLKR